MYFRLLSVILLFYAHTSYSQGRKPAVEDFVGIEVDQPKATPQGTENLFNFEKDINEYTKAQTEPQVVDGIESRKFFFAIALGCLIIGIPLAIWVGVVKYLKDKAHKESVSNIEVLENYRRQKEIAKTQNKDTKKAS